MYIADMTKRSDMLNKTPRVQKGEANQQQQLSDYMRLKALISAKAKN